MNRDENFMRRCLQLAALGKGEVAPNPLVGSVLVNNGKIIGEGYHERFGQAHAEVNCINRVKESDKHLIAQSTLYVSLEPCAHFGKTPPCTALIIKHKIPEVVIGMKDPFSAVNGKGIQQLKAAGIKVKFGVLEEECKKINKRFICFNENKRPYLILKWAQSVDAKIGGNDKNRLIISNAFTKRLVHKWRSEEAAILVGTNTALMDDPLLDNRYWFGKPPLKMVVDNSLRLPATLKFFNSPQPVIIFNSIKNHQEGNLQFVKVDFNNLAASISAYCYAHKIQSVLVEGGAKLLQSFIDKNFWNEAMIITNKDLYVENGLNAPELKNAYLQSSEEILNDRINYFLNRDYKNEPDSNGR